MIRKTAPIAAALSLLAAACNNAPQNEAPASDAASPTTASVATTSPAPTSAPVRSETATPTPPTDSAPILVPEAEKGVKGARNVLLEWARAIERGDWARAASQYHPGAEVSANDIRAKFAPLGRVTVAVGEGEIEGAAGSLYYTVPFTATGNGRTVKGEIMLRRVNDVDGASPEQLRWHIDRVTYT